MVAAVAPIGCMPNTRVKTGRQYGRCRDEPSALARLHNELLPLSWELVFLSIKHHIR